MRKELSAPLSKFVRALQRVASHASALCQPISRRLSLRTDEAAFDEWFASNSSAAGTCRSRICVGCMHSIINMLFSAEGGAVPLFDCLSMPCNAVDHLREEQ